MNEVVTIILLSILSSFIIFSISYILIKKLKINHPKDRSRIYVVLMASVVLLFHNINQCYIHTITNSGYP